MHCRNHGRRQCFLVFSIFDGPAAPQTRPTPAGVIDATIVEPALTLIHPTPVGGGYWERERNCGSNGFFLQELGEKTLEIASGGVPLVFRVLLKLD